MARISTWGFWHDFVAVLDEIDVPAGDNAQEPSKISGKKKGAQAKKNICYITRKLHYGAVVPLV